MPDHESRPEQAGIREPPAPDAAPRPLPPAWQPLTFRGVAAFSRARVGRLLVVQTFVALTVAAAILWFLQHAWFPRILEAIRALPSTGAIENQVLTTPRAAHEPLAADNFIALSVNLEQAASLGSAADLRIEFHRTRLSVCSLFGCLVVPYPAGDRIQFNQPELEAWWGAWRMTILVAVVAATMIYLFACWFLLATVYAVPLWLAGFFKDRQLSLLGAWKLAAAALLAPALAVAASIVAYGLNGLDLLRWLLLALAHIPLGWVYLYFSLRWVPTVAEGRPSPTNPFVPPRPAHESKEQRRKQNPFVGPE
jgi:hypothetical protein